MFAAVNRIQRPARVLLKGGPGGGTTPAALHLALALDNGNAGAASGPGGVAVVDTSFGRDAAIYAADCDLPVNVVCPNSELNSADERYENVFEPEALYRMLATAASNGFGTLVIDSFSDWWAGPGGTLEQVDRRSRGPRSGWQEMSPVIHRMLRGLGAFPGHLILVCSTKPEPQHDRSDGKDTPHPTGTRVVWHDSLEHRVPLVAEVVQDTATVTRSVYATVAPGFRSHVPCTDFAAAILDYCATGEPVPTTAAGLYAVALEATAAAEVDQLRAQAIQWQLHNALLLQAETGTCRSLYELLRLRWEELTGRKAAA